MRPLCPAAPPTTGRRPRMPRCRAPCQGSPTMPRGARARRASANCELFYLSLSFCGERPSRSWLTNWKNVLLVIRLPSFGIMWDPLSIIKPSAEKMLASNVGSLKSIQIRKWCPNQHLYSPRGRLPPLNKKRPPSKRMVIGAPLSDLITIEAAIIWEWYYTTF